MKIPLTLIISLILTNISVVLLSCVIIFKEEVIINERKLTTN